MAPTFASLAGDESQPTQVFRNIVAGGLERSPSIPGLDAHKRPSNEQLSPSVFEFEPAPAPNPARSYGMLDTQLPGNYESQIGNDSSQREDSSRREDSSQGIDVYAPIDPLVPSTPVNILDDLVLSPRPVPAPLNLRTPNVPTRPSSVSKTDPAIKSTSGARKPLSHSRSASPTKPPTRPASRAAPVRTRKRRRSPSPLSQDSFGQPDPNDAEAVCAAYIARTAVFHEPLSQIIYGTSGKDPQPPTPAFDRRAALQQSASSVDVMRALAEPPSSPTADEMEVDDREEGAREEAVGGTPEDGEPLQQSQHDDWDREPKRPRRIVNSERSTSPLLSPDVSLSQGEIEHNLHGPSASTSSAAAAPPFVTPPHLALSAVKTLAAGPSTTWNDPYATSDGNTQPIFGGAFASGSRYPTSDGATQPYRPVETSDGNTQPIGGAIGATSDGCTQPTVGTASAAQRIRDDALELYNRMYRTDTTAGTSDATRATSTTPKAHRRDTRPSDSDIVPDSEPSRVREREGKPADDDDPIDEEEDAVARPSAVSRLSTPQEEEESGDDDVPLATVRRRQAARHPPRKRQKVRDTTPEDDEAPVAVSTPKKPLRKGKQLATPKRARSDNDEDEVPSSVPLQDHLSPAVKKWKGKGKALSSGKRGKQRVTPSGLSSPLSPLSSDGEPAEELGDQTLSAVHEEDQNTELADEDAMDADNNDEQPSPRKTRPRLHIKSESTAYSRRNAGNATPTGQRGRRQRTQSTMRSVRAEATAVLARWEKESYYYPGYVVAEADKGNYAIKYADDTDGVVPISELRRQEFHVDDDIDHVQEGSGRVVGVGDSDVDQVMIKIKKRQFSAELRHLRVSVKAIQQQWEDRKVHAEDIVPSQEGRWWEVPTPSRAAASGNHHGPFGQVGFVISLTGQHNNREELMKYIIGLGGTIVNDWDDIYPVQAGKLTQSGTRLELQASDVGFKEPEFDKVFLLSNEASHKPKYLIALALGVPCLRSSRLSEIEVNFDTTWASLLLPAGTSKKLDASVSQLVDLRWGLNLHHMSEAFTGPRTVATHVFKGMSILLVGPEYLPRSKTPESSHSVPTIVLFMGAERVVAISRLASVGAVELAEFDYVVVKNPSRATRKGQPTYVDLNWVKDCLISGRLHDSL